MAGVLRAEGFVHLAHPRDFSVPEDRLVLQGWVDISGLRRLQLEVQPFHSDGDSVPPRRYSLELEDGRFSGEVRLFDGLNLVLFQSPGGGMTEAYAVFCSATSHKRPPAGGWGEKSPLVLVEPHSLRVPVGKTPVSGFLTEGEDKNVYLVALTPRMFSSVQGKPSGEGAGSPPPRVFRLPVTGRRFEGSPPIEPGGNVLLFRAGDAPLSPGHIFLRSVLGEIQSSGVVVDPPVLKGDEIVVRGRCAEGPVEARISTLVFDPKTGKIVSRESENRRGIVQEGGNFLVILPYVPLPESAYVDFPLLRIQAGRSIAVIPWIPPRNPEAGSR